MPVRRKRISLVWTSPDYVRAVTAVLGLLIIIVAPMYVSSQTEAVLLSLRKLKISDSTTSATNVKYAFEFNTNTSGSVGSVTLDICQNYQYDFGDPCTPPVGLSALGASIVTASPDNNFSINPLSTANRVILGRPAAILITPQQLSYELAGITNPSSVGSFYVRIETHTSTDGSGLPIDEGIVVFATTTGVDITTEVPPYLLFCTGITIDGFNCGTAQGNFISFGELSSRTPRTATSQMLASTNAPYGYSITLAGNTMTAGTNVIPAMTGGTSRPGVSQFGLNSRQNSSPSIGSEPDGPGVTNAASGYNTPNNFRFQNGDIIASSNTTDDYRKLTVSYLVNTEAKQSPGKYVATISYICLANF